MARRSQIPHPRLTRGKLDGEDEADINTLRARWASDALRCFAYVTHQDSSGDLVNDTEVVIKDLITDLGHLCDVKGIDFHDLLQRAEFAYEEEIVEDAVEKEEIGPQSGPRPIDVPAAPPSTFSGGGDADPIESPHLSNIVGWGK